MTDGERLLKAKADYLEAKARKIICDGISVKLDKPYFPRCDKCTHRKYGNLWFICTPQAEKNCSDVYATKECYGLYEEKDTNQ